MLVALSRSSLLGGDQVANERSLFIAGRHAGQAMDGFGKVVADEGFLLQISSFGPKNGPSAPPR